MIAVLMLTACKSGSEYGDLEDQNCYLTVYVYSPGNPIPTRAETNYKDATVDENKINTLQLWVFKHADGELVGYLEASNVTLGLVAGDNPPPFRMLVKREFADYPENVDVYAVANVTSTNCGHAFTRLTTRDELDAAALQGDYFGVRDGHRIEAVPAAGLPMTAVLKNQGIYGRFPALRIGTESQMATLKLTRAVSRLRFVLCRGPKTDEQSNGADVPSHILTAITSLQLHGAQISAQSYLMLNEPFDDSLNPTNPLSESRIRIEPNLYDDTPLNFVYPAGEGYEARSIDPADIPFCYADDDVNK
ncbi:MAG: hypothetical protein K5945_08625, partial [Bacteroidaceae bacterium]|nr:hypothetical protein [Bacteroidaceae bacterium]